MAGLLLLWATTPILQKQKPFANAMAHVGKDHCHRISSGLYRRRTQSVRTDTYHQLSTAMKAFSVALEMNCMTRKIGKYRQRYTVPDPELSLRRSESGSIRWAEREVGALEFGPRPNRNSSLREAMLPQILQGQIRARHRFLFHPIHHVPLSISTRIYLRDQPQTWREYNRYIYALHDTLYCPPNAHISILRLAAEGVWNNPMLNAGRYLVPKFYRMPWSVSPPVDSLDTRELRYLSHVRLVCWT